MAAPDGFSTETSLSPTVDGLEVSLQKLNVWADGFASSWSFGTDQDGDTELDTADNSPSALRPEWLQIHNTSYMEPGPGNKQLAEAERLLKPHHLTESLGQQPIPRNLSFPFFSTSVVNHVARLQGSETTSKNDLLFTESFPVKLGVPHVIGVESLLHLQVPMRTCSHERVTSFLDQGSSPYVKRAGSYKSRSFSPASKKSCWRRSRSQSPKSAWRLNSAQPLPNFVRVRCSRKTTASTRQSRSRSHKLGSLAAQSRTPARMNAGAILSSSQSPYNLPPANTSLPTTQDINGRYEVGSSEFHYEAHKQLLRICSEATKTRSLRVTADRNGSHHPKTS